MPTAKPASTSASAPAVLPDSIEIFRAGRHVDDAGVAHSFSDADLDGMVSSYNPALREAPLTVGHPRDNLPAYGWVKSVSRTADGTLAIAPHQVDPQFAEMLRAGRFKKRSASFYPPQAPNNPVPGKWYVRHVAFLGAQPPAVAGLKDIAFSAGDAEGAVFFSEPVAGAAGVPTDPPVTPQESDDMSKELEEKLAAAQKALDAANAATAAAQADAAAAKKKADEAAAQAASFAEKSRADRKAGFVSFAEAQVKAGKLLPKDRAMAVATLEALADAQPVEFSEGQGSDAITRKVSPAQWLQDLISAARPAVSFGEFAGGKPPEGAGAARGKSDAEIDQAAKAWAVQHKVNYAEALTAVTASFTQQTA